MAGSAKSVLATFLIYAAACAAGVVARPSISLSGRNLASTSLQEDGNKGHVSATFECACNSCVEGSETNVTFNLDISRTAVVCGDSDIRLNGHQLPLQWDGASAVGEGNVTAGLADSQGDIELSLDWQILCINSPEGSSEEYAAQILAVTFYPAGQPGVADTSGFAVSYNAVEQPELLNLVNTPVELSNDEGSFQQWLLPANSSDTPAEELADTPNDIGLETELKDLQSLKDQAELLAVMIEEKDHMIRMRLLHDCSSVASQLKQCKCPKCFIKTSLKIVPDIFRLMKYKFGSLPSSLEGHSCHPSENNSMEPNKNASGTNPDSEQWSIANDQSTTNGINPTSSTPNLNHVPSHSPGMKDVRTRYVFHKVVAIIMMVAILLIIVRYCRNTITCQRRRADLAARCEERRNRRAYLMAACRYRLSRWWNRLFCNNRNINPSQPSNLTQAQVREVGESHAPNQEGGNTAIGAEILGLRRALEYVGGLVRYDGSSDPQLRQRSNQQVVDIGELHSRRVATPAPSSTAPLTSIGSPRTSSVLTYETDSLVTVDSLDSSSATLVE